MNLITHMAFAAGFMEQDPSRLAPIVLAGDDLTCGECGCTYRPTAWSVRTGAGVCPDCARADELLAPWQRFCDVTAAIDELYQGAAHQEQRELMASLLAETVWHFAEWRPESGGAT